MGDGADARRARWLAAQRRAPGRARDRRTTSSLEALLEAGACGFKIHEDYGAYPELIDHVAPVRRRARRLASRSTPTACTSRPSSRTRSRRSPAGPSTPTTSRAAAAATCRTCSGLVREANIICSSTTPTVPFGVNAAAEQVPMIVLNHGGSFARARRRRAGGRSGSTRRRWPPRARSTSSGAIAIVNSDSQGMGRIMETVRRTFQLAHVMRAWRATEAGAATRAAGGSGRRLRRPTASCATSPRSRSSPRSPTASRRHVGSLQPGRLADIVLWKPAWFGVKPELVLKSGYRGLGAARRGQRHGRAGRADALPAGLGRRGRRGREPVGVRSSRRRAPPIATPSRAGSGGGRASSRSAGPAA